jgi:hypothetical protein
VLPCIELRALAHGGHCQLDRRRDVFDRAAVLREGVDGVDAPRRHLARIMHEG